MYVLGYMLHTSSDAAMLTRSDHVQNNKWECVCVMVGGDRMWVVGGGGRAMGRCCWGGRGHGECLDIVDFT
jgi:hypothetical protein